MISFEFRHPHSDVIHTIFNEKMLDNGFLSSDRFYPTLAHTESILNKYAVAADLVLKSIMSSGILEGSDIKSLGMIHFDHK